MSTPQVSPRRRAEVIASLRRGTVPEAGLDLLAVGLERFDATIGAELDTAAGGGSVFKAVRGEYGAGKTFFTRYLAERALRRGFAAAEVQISESQTPLHRLETIYRRVSESLRTTSIPPSAFRTVLDSWLYTLESDALSAGPDHPGEDALAAAVDALLEARLATVSTRTPVFAQALRGYRAAQLAGDDATADGLAAWMGGQPQVAAAAKRSAGIRGELDHFGAMGSSRGCSPSCGMPATLVSSSSSTRSRPSNGCAATCATRPSMRCASSSTRSTPAVTRACTYSSPGRPPSSTVPPGWPGSPRLPSAWRPTSRPMPASTTHAPSRCAYPASTTPCW